MQMETGNQRFCIDDGSEKTFENVWSSWKRDFTIDSLDTAAISIVRILENSTLIVISFVYLTLCKFLYLKGIEKFRN